MHSFARLVCSLHLQFRLASHKLPIVTGRAQLVARADRVCLYCSGVATADELHMVLECVALRPLRHQYSALFTTSTDTVRLFFAQQDQCQVFNLVLDCLDFLNIWTGSPDTRDQTLLAGKSV